MKLKKEEEDMTSLILLAPVLWLIFVLNTFCYFFIFLFLSYQGIETDLTLFLFIRLPLIVFTIYNVQRIRFFSIFFFLDLWGRVFFFILFPQKVFTQA